MEKDYSQYMKIDMPDERFPIKLWKNYPNTIGDTFFPLHWHDEIEFMYFTSGKGSIQCGSSLKHVKKDDFVVINSNELHAGHDFSQNLSWYCLIIDSSLLHSSSIDICETKYITPITQNLIIFKNQISNDTDIINCIKNIIYEYEKKDTGYELNIKSDIYKLLAILLRKHLEKTLTPKEYSLRTRNLERFNQIFKYIETNYTEDITISYLSNILNVGISHFCRLFKSTTGKTLSQYVNHVRINKAEYLLKNTDMNVSEVAMATGFNEISYFSKLFKEYKNISPSILKKYT